LPIKKKVDLDEFESDFIQDETESEVLSEQLQPFSKIPIKVSQKPP
jgi:hypothetical protein